MAWRSVGATAVAASTLVGCGDDDASDAGPDARTSIEMGATVDMGSPTDMGDPLDLGSTRDLYGAPPPPVDLGPDDMGGFADAYGLPPGFDDAGFEDAGTPEDGGLSQLYGAVPADGGSGSE